MVRCEPSLQVGVQSSGEFCYLVGVGYGNRPGSLVVGDVASLAKRLQSGDHTGIGFQGKGQGLDDSIVMLFARCPITLGGQGGTGDLERGIVGNRQTPVGAEPRHFTIGEIAFRDAQQIGDFLLGRLMCRDPAIGQPSWQVHVCPR